MKKISIFALATLTITTFLSQNVSAHSGGTNSAGCHNDHSNGTYHCHRSEVQIKGRAPSSVKENHQDNLVKIDTTKSTKKKKIYVK